MSDATAEEPGGPSLAAFLLGTGSVTAVFLTVAALRFPPRIAQLFSLVIASVTIFTLIVGGVLQWLGYFDSDFLAPSLPTRDDE